MNRFMCRGIIRRPRTHAQEKTVGHDACHDGAAMGSAGTLARLLRGRRQCGCDDENGMQQEAGDASQTSVRSLPSDASKGRNAVWLRERELSVKKAMGDNRMG